MRVVALNVYPLKSAAGIALSRWPLVATGLEHDRRFMLVDQNGDFVTLRGAPRMVTIRPRLEPGALVTFEAPGLLPLSIPLEVALPSASTEVQIWGEHLAACAVSATADAWFSHVLGRPVRLMRFDRRVRRQVDLDYARAGDSVHFADGFPLLVTATASLRALGERFGSAVPMSRFRPNVVIETEVPFIEDGWRRIRVGQVLVDIVKPCARCVGVNVEPLTGRTSKEPLATLATFRNFDGKVLFGQNAIHRGVAALAVGDPVEVVTAEPR